MLKGKITTYVCTKCGEMLFRMKTGAICPNCSTDKIKSYHIFNALTIRTLNRAGYKVLDYTFSQAANLDRKTRLKFADTYDFSRFEPPKGFVYECANEPADHSNNSRNITLLCKHYCNDMPKWEYAIQLMLDKIQVMQWAFTLPIPRTLRRNKS